MNATRYLLDQEILPEQTSTLNQYIDEKMADVESRFNEALLQKDWKIMELENVLPQSNTRVDVSKNLQLT